MMYSKSIIIASNRRFCVPLRPKPLGPFSTHYSTNAPDAQPTLNFCIVGSGPAGFYTLDRVGGRAFNCIASALALRPLVTVFASWLCSCWRGLANAFMWMSWWGGNRHEFTTRKSFLGPHHCRTLHHPIVLCFPNYSKDTKYTKRKHHECVLSNHYV
jgi:hypothetical protein